MQLRPGPLMPANKSLHFLESYGAVVVGIHGLENALVRRLNLLQCEFPVSVSVHQTENYSHRHGTHHAMTAALAHHSAAHHSTTHHSTTHHSTTHRSTAHHSTVITVVVVLVLLLHHRTTWSWLGAWSLGTHSNSATGEDSRGCRE